LLDSDDTSASQPSPYKSGKRETLRKHADRLKGKLDDVREEYKQSGGSIQDRMLNAFMQQIIPVETEDGDDVKESTPRSYVDRPGFSLPLMSTNFRRFNARIGIAFVFQARIERLLTWRVPTHTLSFLAVYTLVCLRPSLLPVVPLALLLFFIMIPSFLARHPPPPAPTDVSLTEAAAAERYDSYGYSGPPVAPPTRVKPAPEMSKDFFRNMRDLQNCMEDFSRVHDGAVALISPYTDFSDERLSSAVFLAIFVLLSLAFVGAHLMPWRAVALLTGWAAIGALHPAAQDFLLSTTNMAQVREAVTKLTGIAKDWIARDIALDEPPEIREVEIYELQKWNGSGFTGTGLTGLEGLGVLDGEWEPWLFSPGPYDPMSPIRIAGARPSGTQFFEEVVPPSGWKWSEKKWSLDLGSRAWVEERCVTGVEVETEGERWVYDLPPEERKDSGGDKGKTAQPKSWEEGTGRGQKGEWRRRRWVRLVERKVVKVSADD